MTAIDTVAWVCLNAGEILCTRSRGMDVYFIPGGKREPGESDIATLTREVKEELDVAIVPATAVHVGTFDAQAHGQEAGVTVRMACYLAAHEGTPAPSNEIEELAWLSYADRHRVAPVDQLAFDHLHRTGRLR